MKKRRVLLRADGSREIGYGHMSRTLALASMLFEEFDCWFVSCAKGFEEESKKYCTTRLLLNQETHFEDFLSIVTPEDIVVLDNYFFMGDYQRKIKEIGAKLVCIDDIHATHFYADIVINHAEGIAPALYSKEPYTSLLLGYNYALLRPEFLEDTCNSSAMGKLKREGIVICIGGSDPLNLTPTIVSAIRETGFSKRITAISNKHIPNCDVQYQLNSKTVASLFHSHAWGIFPASTVSIEAIACRLPFSCGYFIENQNEIYDSLINKQCCIPIGNLQATDWSVYARKIINSLSKEDIVKTITQNQEDVFDKMSNIRLCSIIKELGF